MKIKKSHIINFVLLFVMAFGYGQENHIDGYRIDGDEVVFTFDKRQYNRIKSFDGYERDFQDFNVEDVMVSGEFNDWSEKGWKMKRVDENIFELRKKLVDFNDKFTWEFKFVVNNFYWVEPSEEHLNSVRANKWGFDLGVYNLRMFTANPDEDGNLTFSLDGFEDAKSVVVSGTFNLWDDKSFQMDKTEAGWELSISIRPGIYEYKFVVDGNWIDDPCNKQKNENEHGSFNSIVEIKSKETFILNGHLNAQRVILAGSFNNWSEDDYSMVKTENGWEYTVILSGGKHHYKFIVDGEWILDPDNPVKEYDYNWHINSVHMVK